MIVGIKTWTLALMTAHTLSFIHVLVGVALAIVVFRLFDGRRAA